jgi:S-adenosylmethionine hydrolase
MSRAIITLTTDFGTDSPYVAQMKGVILSINANVQLVDITHSVPPQDVRHGALVMADATPRFPTESIHIGVIDPGVGTSRRIVCAEIDRRLYVAPDNGLLSCLTRSQPATRIVEITNRDFCLPIISRTFHGRDMMAPAAGHLSRGVELEALGPQTNRLVQLDWPTPVVSSRGVTGTVIAVDSFGNLVTNITRDEFDHAINRVDSAVVQCGDQTVQGIIEAYGQQSPGATIALFGSSCRLEIAVVNGNAARQLAIGVGRLVTVSW